jgi:hypothetical protein
MATEYFYKSVRQGKYYDALKKVLKVINTANLQISGKAERNYEDRIAALLESSYGEAVNPDLDLEFVDQRSEQKVLTRVTLFNCDHRPDMSIGKSGIALEVKRVSHGSAIREAIGQSFVYRRGYRFVVVILIDKSGKEKQIKKLFEDKGKAEFALAKFLQEKGIYVLVK